MNLTFRDLKAGDKFIFVSATTRHTDLYLRTNDDFYKLYRIENYPKATRLSDGEPVWFKQEDDDTEIIIIK